MPNSRFALHGVAPHKFTVCVPFWPLSHGLCAFFMPFLTPVSQPLLCQPPSSRFTLHGLRGFEIFRQFSYLSANFPIFWRRPKPMFFQFFPTSGRRPENPVLAGGQGRKPCHESSIGNELLPNSFKIHSSAGI